MVKELRKYFTIAMMCFTYPCIGLIMDHSFLILSNPDADILVKNKVRGLTSIFAGIFLKSKRVKKEKIIKQLGINNTCIASKISSFQF